MRASGDSSIETAHSSSTSRKRVFAVAGEQLGDGGAGLLGDELVDVEERQPDQLRGLAAERRLARAHEADQREVAVHSIRSR